MCACVCLYTHIFPWPSQKLAKSVIQTRDRFPDRFILKRSQYQAGTQSNTFIISFTPCGKVCQGKLWIHDENHFHICFENSPVLFVSFSYKFPRSNSLWDMCMFRDTVHCECSSLKLAERIGQNKEVLLEMYLVFTGSFSDAHVTVYLHSGVKM